jgi:hypothetical protein
MGDQVDCQLQSLAAAGHGIDPRTDGTDERADSVTVGHDEELLHHRHRGNILMIQFTSIYHVDPTNIITASVMLSWSSRVEGRWKLSVCCAFHDIV